MLFLCNKAKIMILFFALSTSLYSSACFTAGSTSLALGSISASLTSEMTNVGNEINNLDSEVSNRKTKTEKILELQKKIRKIRALNYKKLKNIAYNLKADNLILGIEGSVEAINSEE